MEQKEKPSLGLRGTMIPEVGPVLTILWKEREHETIPYGGPALAVGDTLDTGCRILNVTEVLRHISIKTGYGILTRVCHNSVRYVCVEVREGA